MEISEELWTEEMLGIWTALPAKDSCRRVIPEECGPDTSGLQGRVWRRRDGCLVFGSPLFALIQPRISKRSKQIYDSVFRTTKCSFLQRGCVLSDRDKMLVYERLQSETSLMRLCYAIISLRLHTKHTHTHTSRLSQRVIFSLEKHQGLQQLVGSFVII